MWLMWNMTPVNRCTMINPLCGLDRMDYKILNLPQQKAWPGKYDPNLASVQHCMTRTDEYQDHTDGSLRSVLDLETLVHRSPVPF